jgi:hypothetical protein
MSGHGGAMLPELAADEDSFRGLNMIVLATAVDVAFLSDPPASGIRILTAAGVDVRAV